MQKSKQYSNPPDNYNFEDIKVNEQCLLSKDSFSNLVGSKQGQGIYWTTDVNVDIPIKINPGSRNDIANCPAYSLHEHMEHRAATTPNFPVFNSNKNGVKKTWTWTQLMEDVNAFGKACIAVGASPRSSVNVIGFNTPQWGISFYGAIAADYVAAGVYTTNKPDACEHVAVNSDAEIIVLENKQQLAKYE